MTQAMPQRFRITRPIYYRMLDIGLLDGARVELIDGEILEMPAQKNLHASGVLLVLDALRAVFGKGYWIRPQNSLDLSPLSVPDPDVAVVPGDPKTPAPDNPTGALLIVEVADSSLAYDRSIKASLYAVSSIADYWILNLVDRQLEVYRQPVPDATQRFGFQYSIRTIHDPDETVSPLAAPQASILVEDLLPA